MKQLPARLREVLALRELEGLSYKEIAEVVGVPTGTVMSTLFRARERFRQEVSDLKIRQTQPTGSAFGGAEPQAVNQDVVSEWRSVAGVELNRRDGAGDGRRPD